MSQTHLDSRGQNKSMNSRALITLNLILVPVLLQLSLALTPHVIYMNHTECTLKGWILSLSMLLRFIHVVAFDDHTHTHTYTHTHTHKHTSTYTKSMSARSHGLSGATSRISAVYSDALTVPATIELRV